MTRSGWLALVGAAVAVVASFGVWRASTSTSTVVILSTSVADGAIPSSSTTGESPSPSLSRDTAPVAALLLEGEELFHAKGCATCHTGPRSTAMIGGFPSLRAARTWAGERRPGMDAAEYLTESIRAPSAFMSPAFNGSVGPTGTMPELGLTDAEIDALVDHLLSA